MADPERIYLEPPPGAPDTGRLWCKDDVWSGDPAYAQDGPPTEYVRGDLHEALRAKVRALSGPLPSDPDGRMWSTLGYFANREGDDLDTEAMGWAMREITGLRTRVAELEAEGGPIPPEERASWPPEVFDYYWDLWADPANDGLTIGELRRLLRQKARELMQAAASPCQDRGAG